MQFSNFMAIESVHRDNALVTPTTAEARTYPPTATCPPPALRAFEAARRWLRVFFFPFALPFGLCDFFGDCDLDLLFAFFCFFSFLGPGDAAGAADPPLK